MGAECVLDTLRDLPGRKRDASVQDDAQASHAPKISAVDGALTLHESADAIFYVSLPVWRGRRHQGH
jgi:methionyl-tRNA formyltransferase